MTFALRSASTVLLGAFLLVTTSAHAQVPPDGTTCFTAFNGTATDGSRVYGAAVSRFGGGQFERWRLQGQKGEALANDKTKPAELKDFTPLGKATIEVGSFSFAGETWPMKATAVIGGGKKHYWYGRFVGTNLESATDVSEEFPQTRQPVRAVADCSGTRKVI